MNYYELLKKALGVNEREYFFIESLVSICEYNHFFIKNNSFVFVPEVSFYDEEGDSIVIRRLGETLTIDSYHNSEYILKSSYKINIKDDAYCANHSFYEYGNKINANQDEDEICIFNNNCFSEVVSNESLTSSNDMTIKLYCGRKYVLERGKKLALKK